MTYRMSHTGHVKNKYAIVPTRKDGIFFSIWKKIFLLFQCYYCCYHQFWLVDLIDWPISVVGLLVGWGSHRLLLIGLLEVDLIESFLLCPVLLTTRLGLFCTHPNSYDMIEQAGLEYDLYTKIRPTNWKHLRADFLGLDCKTWVDFGTWYTIVYDS